MVRQNKSKLLAMFMAFILILNTLTPMTTVFAEDIKNDFNKDGIKDAELVDERGKEEKNPTKYEGEIESVLEGAAENTIVFDLSAEHKTQDSFLGFEHRLYLDSDKNVTILNQDDKKIDLKDGYTEYIEEANKPYKIKFKKDDEEVIEYTVLVKTADYVPESELELQEVVDFEDQTFEYGIKKDELKEKLPREVTLILNDSTKRKVVIEWNLTEFVVNQAGEIKITGDYELPKTIKGEKISVELKVIISEETIDTVDTTELEKTIKIAKEKSSKDYTEESFNNLENAINNADEALESNDENIIEEALNNLGTAIDQLVINNENFEFNETTGTITKYTGTKENVIIPKEINGVEVNEIGDLAFGEKNLAGKNINKVTLPNTIEKIGEQAFYRAHLTEVVLSNNLIEIGIEAFKHNNLEEVVIPESVRTIKKGAFASNKLNDVILSKNLTTIEINAFKDNYLKKVTLPNALTDIGTGAFASNEIKTLDIPANLTEIKGFANNELTEIEIPKTVIKIGKAAFSANELTTVEIPDSVKHIGEQAFSDMNLEKLIVGDAVQEIGPKAFYDNKLVALEIPKATTVIKEQAFDKNRLSASSVTIVNKRSEVSIGNKAFNPIVPIFLEDVEENLQFEQFKIVITNNQNFIMDGKQRGNIIYFNEKINSETQELIKEGNTSFNIKVESGTTLLINGEEQDGNDVYHSIDIDKKDEFTLKREGVEKEYIVNLDGVFIDKKLLKQQLINANQLIESSLLTDESEKTIVKVTNEAQHVYEKMSTQDEIDQITTNLKTTLKDKRFILEVNLDGEITQYNGTKEELIIPSTWNERTITQINENVFANSDLKKVIIPETIEIIKENAFANNSLEEIQFKVNKLSEVMQKYSHFKTNTLNGLTIKTGAFKQNNLTKIHLPYQVKELGDEAFAENNFKLFSVKIDNYKSQVNLGTNVFDQIAPTFLRTHINEVDKTYLAELIDQDKTIDVAKYTEETYEKYQKAYNKVLIILEKNSTEEEVVQAVEELTQTKQQLEGVKELTQNELKEFLEMIKSLDTQDFDSDIDALWKYIGVVEDNLEEKLTQEDINSFYERLNNYYEKFSTPEKLFGYKILNDHEVAILEYRGVSSSLIIPNEIDGRKVTQIGKKAFDEKRLNTVSIPETVYKLDNQSFASNNLKTIQLPENLKQLGTEVFKDNKLKEISIPGRLAVIPNATFSENETLEKVHLAEGVKEINRLAFAQSKIQIVNFPNSLEKIGELAFASNKISEVHLAENVVEIGASAFQENNIEAGNATINNVKKYVKEGKNAFANNGLDSNEKIELIYNGIEVTTIEVDSVDNIEVEFNTKLNAVEEKLPQEIELKINQSLQRIKVKSEVIDISWISTAYNSTQAGTYKFVGVFDLPEDIDAEKPEVTVEVTVLEDKTAISELKAAIKHAEKVNNDLNATVDEVEEAINNLNDKLGVFKPDNNLSELEKTIQLAKDTDKKGKTDSSIEKLEQVIKESEAVLKDEYITQAKVDQAVEDLEVAISGLVDKPVDKSNLTSALEKAAKVNTADKTEASVKVLDVAIKKAKEIKNSKKSTQNEVDKITKELLEAIKGLIVLEDPDENSNGDTGSGDSDEDSNDDTGTGDSDEDSNGDTGTDDSDEDSNGDTGSGDSDEDSNDDTGTGDSEEDSNGDTGSGDSDEDSNDDTGTGDSDEDSNGDTGSGDSDEDSNDDTGTGDSDEDSNGDAGIGNSDDDLNGESSPNGSDNNSIKDGLLDKSDAKETDKISKEKTENEKDEELPSTATNIFNLLALGLALIVLGLLFVRKRKVN